MSKTGGFRHSAESINRACSGNWVVKVERFAAFLEMASVGNLEMDGWMDETPDYGIEMLDMAGRQANCHGHNGPYRCSIVRACRGLASAGKRG
jgi:hypothetical protein